ncbi:hypothetical protein K458DRAFT_430195 [Lentithecium fluviatile CBS 122367]|uniref:S-adenosyl-L-methionine-dependent methyltransferase n=1 Tax=Lentithecium fluviatile CBS 122367 TaxID=1168545 RepID=A0A6G1J899_9PLEO|nr:hypothetical protein K458DRAFT_430195 [Lentithecium fluviatile CBS 122367]
MNASKQSVYWMESESERKRMASNHYIAKDATNGALVFAPIDFSRPVKVLDSGTADGTWLLDLRANLSALPDGASHVFIGTDMNPAPLPTDPPPDVTFQVQDINKPWPEGLTDSFDLVHQRLSLLGAGPNAQLAVHRLCGLVRPGGWIQLIEATMVFPEDVVSAEATPAFWDLLRLMRGVAEHMGAAWLIGDTLREHLEAEGFVDVQEREIVLKMGRTNPDEALARNGVVSCGMAVEGLAAFAKGFPAEKQPLEMERYGTLKADLVRELSEKGAVFPLKAVWARRPE